MSYYPVQGAQPYAPPVVYGAPYMAPYAPAPGQGPAPYQVPVPLQQAPAYQPYLPPTTYTPSGPVGRRKALLVGCCYAGTRSQLNGCINDVNCIKYCLTTKFQFPDASIVVLRDDVASPDFSSTRYNIFRGIQWLMSDLRPGDSLFFHFSGHGSQKRDYNGDEADGMDETILPSDHERAGQIVDDELNAALVRPLPHGVTLHAVIDACHSGTAMDLAYQTALDRNGRFYWQGGQSASHKGTAGGTVFQIGACQDGQVAADTNAMSGGTFTGAATFSFIQSIEKYGPQTTYAFLLTHMHESLQQKGARQGGGGGGGGGLIEGLLGALLGGGGGGGGGGVQTPVMCCDKPIDLYNTRLSI